MRRRYHLIRNRFAAVLAVCILGLFVTEDLKAVFAAPPSGPGWLISLNSPPSLPIWIGVTLNLLVYGALLWGAFSLLTGTEGMERVMVAGFCFSLVPVLLSPIAALSRAPVITIIRVAAAAGSGTAFVVALVVLVKSPPFARDDAKTALRLVLFLAGLIAIIFVAGAAIYFLAP